MTDDFEKRLKAAAQRVQAEHQSQETGEEKRKRTEEAQVAKINDAIKDWKARIVPIILKAIARSNEIVRDAKIQLASNPSSSRTYQVNRLGPPIPSLPIMIVTVRSGAIPKATLASQLAGGYRPVKASLPDLARSPQVQFGITSNGDVFIGPQNYPSKSQGVMEVGQFDKTTVEGAIAEFIETILRPKGGNQ